MLKVLLLFLICLLYTPAFGFQNADVALFPIWREGKIGFIDKTGKVVITPQFQELVTTTEGAGFREGLACVRVGILWGFIDKSGKFVIKPSFPIVRPSLFEGGLAVVHAGGTNNYRFIDKTGRKILTRAIPDGPDFRFSEGLLKSSKNGKFGFVNKAGLFVIQPKFTQAEDFTEGLAVVRLNENDSYGYIDKTGKFLISPQFDVAYSFSEGLALAYFKNIEGGLAYIDKTGKIVVEPQFADASDFSEGLAQVIFNDGENDKVGFIDKSGKIVIAPQFDPPQARDNLRNYKGFSEGLAAVTSNGNLGYIDKTGKFAIPPQFEDGGDFYGGLASVSINSKEYYIDKSGKEVAERVSFSSSP